MKLETKNFLTFAEINKKELLYILNLAIKLKKSPIRPLLKNKTLAMIFEKPSTRTRISFQVGMSHLGGHSLSLSPNDMQLSRGETISDTAKTLSRYVDVVMARVFEHKLLQDFAKSSTVPLINGLSDSFHPCQILADFMTILEKKKKLEGIKIAWIGDGNNVCNSLLYGCSIAGISISVATPKEFQPNSKVLQDVKKSLDVELTTDPANAVSKADVVMTDTVTSIHNTDLKRIKKFLPKYQVNSALMSKAKNNAIFMHCLPAKRTFEVTSSVIDGKQSVVWDEAENRLHTQKALLSTLDI